MANLWDERFGREEWVYGKEPNEFLHAHAERIPKGPVLSLGEGEGRNAVFLASLGHRVVAVDSSIEGLKKVETLARERNVEVETIHADLASWTAPVDAFAGVVSIFCHLPPEVRRRAHRGAARALVPGGVLLLEAYRPEQLSFGTGGPKDVSMLYTLDDLRADFAELTIDHAEQVEREVREGLLHTGRAATVQLIARRA